MASGFSEFNRIRVLEACEDYFKRRLARIEREKEEFVTEKMKPWKFLGLFTISGKSREKAEYLWENAAGSEQWFTPKYIAESKGWYQFIEISNLYDLANNSTASTIFISDKYAWIFRD